MTNNIETNDFFGDNQSFEKIRQEIEQIDQLLTDNRMMLAKKIALAIGDKYPTKSAFAKAINVDPSTVSRWLSGTHNFESDTLFRIEAVLAVDLINLEINESQDDVEILTVFSNQPAYIQNILDAFNVTPISSGYSTLTTKTSWIAQA